MPDTATDQIADAMQEIGELVGYLAARWQDEYEYENLDEYRAAIQARLPAGYIIESMSRRPFGFVFTGSGYRVRVTVTPKGLLHWQAFERA